MTVDARVAILDVMRGFAAAAVAWFHFTHAGGLLEDGWLKGSGSYGWLGVEVFFVISGFVLPYSLWKGRYRLGDDTATFLVKRLVRLEPPYLITLAITVGLLYGSAATPGFRGPPPNVSPAQLLLHVGYLNSYFGYPSLSPVFWTLAIELQFYLLLAFTYPLVSNQSRGATVLLPATLACLALALPHDLLVLQYLGLFGLGINAFRFYARLHGRLAFFAISGVLTAVSAVALSPLIAGVGVASAMTIVFVPAPRSRAFAAFGAMSYSFYLLHVPIGGRVINLGARFAHTFPTQLLTLTLAFIGSSAAAFALYRLVEAPAQRYSARFRYASRRSQPATTLSRI